MQEIEIEIQTNTHHNFPPTPGKKTPSAHSHTQHTDSHTNTITQKEKWVYYTNYSLPLMKRIRLMYATVRLGTVYMEMNITSTWNGMSMKLFT